MVISRDGIVKLNKKECISILSLGDMSMLKNFRKYIDSKGVNLEEVHSFLMHKRIDKYYWMFLLLDEEIQNILSQQIQSRHEIFKCSPLCLADYVE